MSRQNDADDSLPAAGFCGSFTIMIAWPRLIFVLPLVLALGSGPASGQGAPYDGQLLRLAEVLGSIHFLRNLCGEHSSAYRLDMQRLLETENPDPERHARLVASFNQGYRAFSTTYSNCTEQAMEAITRYMAEGEKLAREIVVRYGN